MRKLIKAAGTEKTKRKGRPKATKRKPGAAFFLERQAAIGRIIKAVGKQPDDENQLAAEIDKAESGFAVLGLYEGAKPANRYKLIKRIHKGVEKLVTLINTDPLIRDAINERASPFDSHLPPAEQLLNALRRLEKSQAKMRERRRSKIDLPPVLKGRRPTRIEWLAGVTLPLVYEKRFGSDITFDRDDDGKPEGPLINFIEATMAELELRYSRDSIGTAISHLRAVRDNCRE